MGRRGLTWALVVIAAGIAPVVAYAHLDSRYQLPHPHRERCATGYHKRYETVHERVRGRSFAVRRLMCVRISHTNHSLPADRFPVTGSALAGALAAPMPTGQVSLLTAGPPVPPGPPGTERGTERPSPYHVSAVVTGPTGCASTGPPTERETCSYAVEVTTVNESSEAPRAGIEGGWLVLQPEVGPKLPAYHRIFGPEGTEHRAGPGPQELTLTRTHKPGGWVCFLADEAATEGVSSGYWIGGGTEAMLFPEECGTTLEVRPYYEPYVFIKGEWVGIPGPEVFGKPVPLPTPF